MKPPSHWRDKQLNTRGGISLVLTNEVIEQIQADARQGLFTQADLDKAIEDRLGSLRCAKEFYEEQWKLVASERDILNAQIRQLNSVIKIYNTDYIPKGDIIAVREHLKHRGLQEEQSYNAWPIGTHQADYRSGSANAFLEAYQTLDQFV